MLTVVVIIISYLIGSIPTGYLFTTRIKNIDVRDVGSGNVGATNAARALGMKYGVLVALLDVFKGFLAVSIAYLLQGEGMAYLPYLA
ncbi:MAG: glycerol-3-phosphate acyltransferase, partial [Bacillota bacterium]